MYTSQKFPVSELRTSPSVLGLTQLWLAITDCGFPIEIGGQDQGRMMQSCQVELPPRQRVEIPNQFFSLTYIHIRSGPKARLGIHCPTQKDLHLIGTRDWGNVWVYGTDILLAGYMTREEFGRRARFVQTGSPVSPNHTTQQKNLAVPVSELRPLSELFNQIKSTREHA